MNGQDAADAARSAARDGGDPVVAAGVRALLICRLATGLYLVDVLLNLARPRVLPHEAALTVLEKPLTGAGSLGRMLAMPRAVFWTVLAGIVVGVALQVFAVLRPLTERQARVLLWLIALALLGPFTLIPLTVISSYPLIALACVPSTAAVLWLLHGWQRFARLPLRVLLAAFCWGALFVSGFTRACTGLVFGFVYASFTDGRKEDLTGQLDTLNHVFNLLILHMSVLTQLSAAAGVAVFLILLRNRVVDLVTGLALGAAVGLGIAFSDSVLFIELWGSLGFFNGATGGFEYWIRQSVGILGGPVVFGALLGAGMGVAAQLPERRTRLLVAGAGLTAAVGGAVASENLSAWFSRLAHDDIDIGSTFDTLVASPALWLAAQLPFLALVVPLLVLGWRRRAAAAHAAVLAEAAAGGVVADQEVPFLVNPARRLWAVVTTWRTRGRPTALALYRLQSAQLDAASRRWHRENSSAASGTTATILDTSLGEGEGDEFGGAGNRGGTGGAEHPLRDRGGENDQLSATVAELRMAVAGRPAGLGTAAQEAS